MLNLQINRLNLTIENAAGQEHRVRPITARAMTLLAERLDLRLIDEGGRIGTQNIERLNVPSVDVNLNQMSDEQAAGAIASAIVEALALKLKV